MSGLPVRRSAEREGGSRTNAGKTDRLLTPAAATLLGGALRDAVVAGTGRTLGAHPGRIAGKTGTAEVANAPSHAWFVGFAPHRGEKQIAFAVLFEQAGYGGSVAAPAAGEIVTAAAARGLIE